MVKDKGSETPLRGEMFRGADFIIGVVSARGSDPI